MIFRKPAFDQQIPFFLLLQIMSIRTEQILSFNLEFEVLQILEFYDLSLDLKLGSNNPKFTIEQKAKPEKFILFTHSTVFVARRSIHKKP